MKTPQEVYEATDKIPSPIRYPGYEMWHRYTKDLSDNHTIVDFGTGHGRSASALGLFCPQATVYTFDIGEVYINHTCTAEEYEAETREFIANTGATNVHFTRENSLEKEWDMPIDALNIDSGYIYPETKQEIDRWVPFVRTGGMIFLHSYFNPHGLGVRQAIDEYIAEHNNLKLLEVIQSGQVESACLEKL